MNRKGWKILVALLAAGALVWLGGGWFWRMLLAMHGRHSH
jgi:hypothetical protein